MKQNKKALTEAQRTQRKRNKKNSVSLVPQWEKDNYEIKEKGSHRATKNTEKQEIKNSVSLVFQWEKDN